MQPIRRWLMPMFLVVFFLLPLIVLNRQFIRAAGEMDNLLDTYSRVAVEWARTEDLIDSADEESRAIVCHSIESIERWISSPELERVSGFTSLDYPLDFLQGIITSLPGDKGNLSVNVNESLLSINTILREFRDKLDGGISILFLAQVLLILLLMILIVLALDDRTRQKYQIESSRKIQVEITRAQEEERNRIALDLHDDIAQDLSWIRMNLVKEYPESTGLEIVDKLITRVRYLSQSLRTPDFSVELFNDAVRDLLVDASKRSDVIFRYLPGRNSPTENPEIYGHVYRIIQECLNNAVKHSGSCRAFIELQEENNAVYYEYRDNGAGFNPDNEVVGNRLGLKGIRNRVNMVNGSLKIISTPGEGMKLTCCIPLGKRIDD